MYEKLMEEAVTEENCRLALAAVKRNQGAAGIARMRTTELESHLQAHWAKIRVKLLNGTYVPAPVRGVEIPKASGGIRTLGIPTVQDRFIQQLLLQVMTPIWEPMFSEHSYGFRPGRSAQKAMRAAQGNGEEGKTWVVDIDITKFFDHVSHDILMGRIAQVIRDKRVLHLIGKYLRRGAMVEGVVTASVEGTPQGGPTSPLPANIYLDALDKELERRGHSFCRYADDCNIYVRSEAAAERTLESIQDWIEKRLRLKVNATKSGKGRVWERKFLGFRLNRELQIGIAPESEERFKAKVREMWRGSQSRTSNELRDRWRQYIRGWWGLFPTGRGSPAHHPAGAVDSTSYTEMLLAEVAQYRRPRTAITESRGEATVVESGSDGMRRMVHGPQSRDARRFEQLTSSSLWLSGSIRSCGGEPLSSTAGCGKPHVRWCGRVTGRNPGHST